ncbi:hypothetical protein STEPF1_07193 [Streptomyces sp. F-1]|nr:hypothetical protein STEPF1_07193 [Streptomyces sp. F-1]
MPIQAHTRLVWRRADPPPALGSRIADSRRTFREPLHGLVANVPYRRQPDPCVRAPRGARHPRGGRRRSHGHHAPGPGTHPGRLPAARRLQRDPQPDPTGHRPLRPRGLLRRGRRLRRDQHLRGQPLRPRRVRHPRTGPRTVRGRRPRRPRGRRRVHRPRRPPPLGAGLHGPRHQTAHPRTRPVHHPARRLPAQRRGPGHRRRRRAARGDHPGPPPDQGRRARRPARPGRPRPRPPGDRLGDRRDHRHHAAGLRDRRGPHRPGAAGHRPDRPELRHRPRGDERAPALPRPQRPHPAVLHAQRGPARPRQGRRPLPADRPRAGGRAGDVRA